MTQIEALARRAAAAGVAIQTLSSFAVGENALAVRKASVDWGNASANWSPAGRPLLCSSAGLCRRGEREPLRTGRSPINKSNC